MLTILRVVLIAPNDLLDISSNKYLNCMQESNLTSPVYLHENSNNEKCNEIDWKSRVCWDWQFNNESQYTEHLNYDDCPLDCVDNPNLKSDTSNRKLLESVGNMPFLSRDPNLLNSQEEENENFYDKNNVSTFNKENQIQQTLMSKKNGNKDYLGNGQEKKKEHNDNVYDLDIEASDFEDDRDKDFDINEYSETEPETYSSIDSSDAESIIPDPKKRKMEHSQEAPPVQSVIDKILEQKNKDYRNKQFRCKFCNEDVSSRNFLRHLQRHHNHEKEVQNIMSFPLKSKERKLALERLRNDLNFELYLRGQIRPKKQLTVEKQTTSETEYYPCIYCKAIFSKTYLNRHVKKCIANNEKSKEKKPNIVSSSQTKVACSADPTAVISTLAIRKEVLNMMRGDKISFVAKKDLLILHYGETYLKSQKRERKEYSCSNKLRELARLLLEYRSIVNDDRVSFKDLLDPKNFDNVVLATRQLCGYDPINKAFKTPSLAMHTGTTLKLISDELIHLILRGSKGFQTQSKEMANEWQKNVKNFKKLVEARWNKEISSVANKDLNEKRWRKPLLVPLISDVKKFREGVLNYAKQCEKEFLEQKDNEQTYKLLVQCTLALVILFNRRRIGDVQYLKVEDYVSERKTDFQDFETTLTESEKILTQQYKRVVNRGKGSRAVVILIPPLLKNFLDLLILNRKKYISSDNRYVFALPKSKLKWAQGDVAIKNLTSKISLENPAAISSNKLRKHIATAMQILTMSKNDCKQFSKFMGHTEKTHEEFYELPVDIYQTAKVVKLLLMMEKGIPTEFKGKTLSEIEVGADEFIEIDNDNIDMQAVVENNQFNDEVETEDLPLNKVARTSLNRSSVVLAKIPKENTTTKRGWSPEKVQLVKDYFKSFLIKKTYPSSAEIKEFIKTNKSQRSVPVIKSKIQHLFRLKAK